MKRKVLILGSKGNLGQELVLVFQKEAQVFGWDLPEKDITDKEKTAWEIRKLAPQIVINATAHNGVDLIEDNQEEFQKALLLNGEIPGWLAQLAKELGAVFVHYSSDYVFDGKKERYQEEDKPNPLSRYGLTKAMGEEQVMKVKGKNYLIRTSKIFSQRRQANQKKSFFEIMLELAQKEETIKAVNEEKSCFTYAPDLAQATKKLFSRRFPFGIYHLINEGEATWFEGAKALFELMGRKVELIPIRSVDYPRPAPRPLFSVLVNSKFPKIRNYRLALREWIERMETDHAPRASFCHWQLD